MRWQNTAEQWWLLEASCSRGVSPGLRPVCGYLHLQRSTLSAIDHSAAFGKVRRSFRLLELLHHTLLRLVPSPDPHLVTKYRYLMASVVQPRLSQQRQLSVSTTGCIWCQMFEQIQERALISGWALQMGLHGQYTDEEKLGIGEEICVETEARLLSNVSISTVPFTYLWGHHANSHEAWTSDFTSQRISFVGVVVSRPRTIRRCNPDKGWLIFNDTTEKKILLQLNEMCPFIFTFSVAVISLSENVNRRPIYKYFSVVLCR